MNVLLVNTSERTGGAAIAASRLMHALNRHGVNARMIVRQKRGFPFYWERMVIWLHNRLSRRMLWYVDIANAGTDITLLPAFREADVIHLHWVNQGFLSLEVIDRILHSGKRIVWTMHDQWPYTAICHHSRDCRRFQTRCHDCPQLCYPSNKDLSYKVFTRKLALMGNAHVTFVGCSQWIAGLAATSALLRGQRIVSIPNAVPADAFHPMDRLEARRRMHLPEHGHLVLFGSCKVSDRRKGADYMIAACRRLSHARVTLVIVGSQGRWMLGELPAMDVLVLDYISDEHQMAALYSAADVYVTPSLMENLPNTIAEAMSVGTPCVGFHTGGIPEMIDHLENGYVARYCDVDDLARGIDYVLDHDLREAARQKAAASYGEDAVAKQYIRIYEE